MKKWHNVNRHSGGLMSQTQKKFRGTKRWFVEAINRDKHTEQFFARNLEAYNSAAPRMAEHGKVKEVWEVTEEELQKLRENRDHWELKFREWTSYDEGRLHRLKEDRKKSGNLRLVPD